MIDILIFGIAGAGLTMFIQFCIGDPNAAQKEVQDERILSFIGEWIMQKYIETYKEGYANFWKLFLCKYCFNFYVCIGVCLPTEGNYFINLIIIIGVSHLILQHK